MRKMVEHFDGVSFRCLHGYARRITCLLPAGEKMAITSCTLASAHELMKALL